MIASLGISPSTAIVVDVAAVVVARAARAVVGCLPVAGGVAAAVIHLQLLGGREPRRQSVAMPMAPFEEDAMYDGLGHVDDEEADAKEEHCEGEVGVLLQVRVIQSLLGKNIDVNVTHLSGRLMFSCDKYKNKWSSGDLDNSKGAGHLVSSLMDLLTFSSLFVDFLSPASPESCG